MNYKKEKKVFEYRLNVLQRLIAECTTEANQLVLKYVELDNEVSKKANQTEAKDWQEFLNSEDAEKFLRIISSLHYIEEPTNKEVIDNLKELIEDDEKEIKQKQRIR